MVGAFLPMDTLHSPAEVDKFWELVDDCTFGVLTAIVTMLPNVEARHGFRTAARAFRMVESVWRIYSLHMWSAFDWSLFEVAEPSADGAAERKVRSSRMLPNFRRFP